MAGPKTRPTDADVGAFLASLPDQRRRDDGTAMCRLMQEVTGEEPDLKRLSDVDLDVLRELIAESARGMAAPG